MKRKKQGKDKRKEHEKKHGKIVRKVMVWILYPNQESSAKSCVGFWQFWEGPHTVILPTENDALGNWTDSVCVDWEWVWESRYIKKSEKYYELIWITTWA